MISTYIKFTIIVLFLSITLSAKGEDAVCPKVKIDSIVVKGNTITGKNVILNELNFTKGDSVDSNKIKYFRERIFSLGLFSSVELKIDNINNRNILQISVEESWYIYPYPYLALKDRDIKKISVGLDLQIKNFQGRNETLKAKVLLGYDPGFSLVYIKPAIDDKGKYSLAFETGYYKTSNKNNAVLNLLNNVNFKQDFLYFYTNIGRRLNIYSRITLMLGYEYIQSPFYKEFINISGGRIDRIPSIGIDYNYDTRDLSQFPTEGILMDAAMVEKGIGLSGINYQVFTAEYRQFISFGDLITKYRIFSRDVFGAVIPLFDYSYLGYGERIRGHYNSEEEGRYLHKASIELAYPILKQFNLDLDFIPIIPNSLLRYRVGIYAQLFGEAGTVLQKYQKISLKNLSNGFGCGLTFLILPYNIVRTEIAFNEKFKSQFIFDLGISF